MRHMILTLATLIASPVSANVIEIETPIARHVYVDCVPVESHISRYGTVATIIADCGNRQTTAAPIGWTPDPHPDGLTLRFESRLVVNFKFPQAFLECELTDYAVTPFGSSQRWQCIDDPIPAARRPR
jgi:hypothetical protein